MPRQFVLPDLGEGVKEGQVLRLLVNEGDEVAEDQLLMEVETDKAAVEIPSPHSGIVARVHVHEQQVVNVGELMITFGESGNGEVPAAVSAERRPRPAAAAPPAPTRSVAGGRKPASPAVRKLARTMGVDLETITGSGPGGRVTRRDVEQAASAPPPRQAPAPAVAPVTAPAAPAPTPTPVAPVEPPGIEDRDEHGPVRRQPISQARKTIASVMSQSRSTIPHVTDTDDADVTDLDRLRRGYNDGVDPARRIGMLAFVVRAVVRALQRYPLFNASFDEPAGEIVYRRYYNIAVGVQTERGLVPAVLRNAETMSIPQINDGLAEVIERVRSGAFTIADTKGATYTISNAGAMGGSRYSTPIITLPQVAVLAVGRSRLRPWVVDGEVTPRLIMPLSHSMDHRVIDGAEEIAFMQHLIGDLEQPARLML
jgi:pyruvate/2-oxoglutarate dehydrogenase complex dihydrolipoamide acyltransferase (E2) component